MLSDKVHVLVKSLNACHVGLCIIREFYFLSAAYSFRAPVKISHIYRASNLTCYGMETCLPSLYRLACAFRCEGEVYYRSSFHFIDYAQGNIAASFPVNRYAAKLAEKPSKRAPEKFSLDHTVRLTSY